MTPDELQTLQSLLVALVRLPDAESAPQFDRNMVKSPLAVVANMENRRHRFWKLYEEAQIELTRRYNAQPRNKIVFPEDPPSTPNSIAENVSEPASKAMALFDRLDNIFTSQSPQAEAKREYEAARQANENLDVYEWAEVWCGL